MGIEIERKFLVIGDAWKTDDAIYYCQGYLHADEQRTVRVRIAGATAQLTIKGKSVDGGRPEFEYPIPLTDAQELLAMCDGPHVEKYRHRVEFAGCVWEIDEFLGDNAGLVVAEVELERRDQELVYPDWVGREVTQDPRYRNSHLVHHPYSRWG